MLTTNADHQHLMSRMQKSNPNIPPEAQDKRMVVVLEQEAWDGWLPMPMANERELILMAPAAI